MVSTIDEALARYGQRIDGLLREVIPPDRKDWLSEPIWHHLNTGGKRMRPALCLMTCEALGGNAEDAVPFATAVELLHNMFLLHDDIEDGDTVRRDRPAVWVMYGLANGVNAGDYLLARAYHCVLRTPVSDEQRVRLVQIFTDVCERTIEGQALDINRRADAHFRTSDYMRLVQLKTGYYLALGMVGGAIIADANEAVVQGLWRLGEALGPAFQIRDDVIDLTAGKGRGGMLGSDIREGKASFLYAHACELASPAQRARLVEVMAKRRDDTSTEDVQWAMSLYRRLGAIDAARRTTEALVADALSIIDSLPMKDKQAFRELANYVAQRET